MPPLPSRRGVESVVVPDAADAHGTGVQQHRLVGWSHHVGAAGRADRTRHDCRAHICRDDERSGRDWRTGVGATDPFCAAWATYAGTLQALGVAGSFGGLSSDELAVLELRAA